MDDVARPAPAADPIVAIATASGRGAVGIVRASGPDLSALVDGVCGRPLAPRHATFLPFRDADGEPIDTGIALHFPAPHSYTGEDVVELQAHGGPVVLGLLLERCLALLRERFPRARLAEPGEFTARAFLNDKLDLLQAEAVADLIDASTAQAARSASRSLAGAFSDKVDALARELVELRALVEATLDFPEEEIDFIEQAQVRERLARVRDAIGAVQAQARHGALLRDGLRVVIAGQPNVGKSSLLNALAGQDVAIVTPIAGTTRDRIEQPIQIDGVPLHVVDTAGLRSDAQASDEVERIGIERSWSAIGQADLVLFVHDLSRRDDAGYRHGDAAIAGQLPHGVPVLHVGNKADLVADGVTRHAGREPASPGPAPGTGHRAPDRPAAADDGVVDVRLAARTGEGLDALRVAIRALAGDQASGEGSFIARQRHLQALAAAASAVADAGAELDAAVPALELLAEQLREAHEALGSMTGAFTPDDLLGEIFGRFCIGK